jgi:hypothetical protein
MSSWPEVLGNGAIRGEEALRMPGGFKPLHPSLPLAGRLMRVLRAVIEVAVLAMFHTREDVLLCRAIAFQLIRDDHARYIRQLLEEFAEELLRRFLVPPMLDENIQDVAVLINRPPQVMPCAIDPQTGLWPF